MRIKIHRILKGSCANGPGTRNVVWFQGCTLNCPDCFNPLTHDPHGGKWMSVDAICDQLTAPDLPCDGITVSGGEPFQQPDALFALLSAVRARSDLPILVFSGYTEQALYGDPKRAACLKMIDALLCGPYCREFPPDHRRFLSSSNQKLVLLTDRYTESDFFNLPLQETIITEDGHVIISGIFS